jgi:hypothetical protein
MTDDKTGTGPTTAGPDVAPPKRTGKPLEQLSLNGYLIPWLHSGQPQLARMPGSAAFYLMCFSSPERLRSFMGEKRIHYDRIKQIDDGRDFVASIRETAKITEIIIICDPWTTADGRVRFTQLLED